MAGAPGGSGVQPSREDRLLGQLVYMSPDALPTYVQHNLDEFDEAFYRYLEHRIGNALDLDERVTLSTLHDALTDIMQRMAEQMAQASASQQKEDEHAVTGGGGGSGGGSGSDDGNGGGAASEAESSTATATARANYAERVDALVRVAAEPARLQIAIESNYDRFDADFLHALSRLASSSGHGNAPAACATVLRAINHEMKQRMERASANLGEVLRAGAPDAISAALHRLGSTGGIDEPFCLLLQANIEQARQANASDAVLRTLQQTREQAGAILDESVADRERKLIRALLRTHDADKRRQMLFAALSPKQQIFLPDGERKSEGGLEIDGKRFVQLLRELIEKFGNVDERIVAQCIAVGEQAEEVAREIFDLTGKDARALQDEAFHTRSMSVFDLEQMEVQARIKGQRMPWEDAGALGFGEDGRKPM